MNVNITIRANFKTQTVTIKRGYEVTIPAADFFEIFGAAVPKAKISKIRKHLSGEIPFVYTYGFRANVIDALNLRDAAVRAEERVAKVAEMIAAETVVDLPTAEAAEERFTAELIAEIDNAEAFVAETPATPEAIKIRDRNLATFVLRAILRPAVLEALEARLRRAAAALERECRFEDAGALEAHANAIARPGDERATKINFAMRALGRFYAERRLEAAAAPTAPMIDYRIDADLDATDDELAALASIRGALVDEAARYRRAGDEEEAECAEFLLESIAWMGTHPTADTLERTVRQMAERLATDAAAERRAAESEWAAVDLIIDRTRDGLAAFEIEGTAEESERARLALDDLNRATAAADLPFPLFKRAIEDAQAILENLREERTAEDWVAEQEAAEREAASESFPPAQTPGKACEAPGGIPEAGGTGERPGTGGEDAATTWIPASRRVPADISPERAAGRAIFLALRAIAARADKESRTGEVWRLINAATAGDLAATERSAEIFDETLRDVGALLEEIARKLAEARRLARSKSEKPAA